LLQRRRSRKKKRTRGGRGERGVRRRRLQTSRIRKGEMVSVDSSAAENKASDQREKRL